MSNTQILMPVVSLKTAKLAKEVGYGIDPYIQLHRYYNIETNIILTPYQSELQKWLREKSVVISIVSHGGHSDWNLPLMYSVRISSRSNNKESWGNFAGQYMDDYFGIPTYEEALEKALYKGLQILKERQDGDTNKT
jgi:hypothetical protein